MSTEEKALAEKRARLLRHLDELSRNETLSIEDRNTALETLMPRVGKLEQRDEQPAKPVASEPETVKRDQERRETEAREFADAQRAAAASEPEARYGYPLPDNARLTGLPNAGNRTLTEFGDYVRSLSGHAEQRVSSEGTATAGGHLVPTQFAAPVLDLAVNAMKVKAAGARIVPMDSQKMDIARLDGDPTPSWRAENAAIAESDPLFGKVSLSAKSLSVFTRVSLELLEDATPNFGEVLATSLARAFALELDRVALYGTGASNQPLGLKGTAGVNITNFTGVNGGTLGATTAYAAGGLGGAVMRLKAKNYEPTGMIMAPRTEAQLGMLADTTGQPLNMPEYISQVPRYASGQLPVNLTVGTSTDTSDVFVGDFSNLIVGLRTDFRLMVNTDAYMLSNGQVAYVGWLRADIAVLRAGAFEVLAGLKA